MKYIFLLLLSFIFLSSCSCDMEITYCDGLTNNNIKIIEYDAELNKINLAGNVDSIVLYSENKKRHLAVDGNGMYSHKDSILEINCLEYGDELMVLFYQKKFNIDTIHFRNISSKIENTIDKCDKKRTSTYPTFQSNSIHLLKSFHADCNNYIFEIRR